MRGNPHNAFARSPGPILQAQPAPLTVSVRRNSSFSPISIVLLDFYDLACRKKGVDRIVHIRYRSHLQLVF